MCEDVVTHASALETTTTIIVCLIGAAEVVMLAIGLFMLWTLQNSWKNVIKIMASLPHVALQHAISKYSVVQLIDDKVSKDEIKHWTLYDQMISARTVKKGIPMVKLVALFITNVVCAIVGVVTVTLIVTTKSKQLNVIPYRVYYAGEVMTNAFRCSSLLLRSLASANGISMCDDRIATLLTKIKDSRTSLIDSVNNFIAIEDNGYLSGVLSSTTSIVAMLFQTDRDWLDEKVESERLLVMPRLIALDVMSEQLTIAYQKLIVTWLWPEIKIPPNDISYLQFIHWVLNLDERVFQDVTNSYTEVMNSMLDSLSVVSFATAGLFMLVGLFFYIWITVILHNIAKTIRICLSSLSIIEFHFLKDSPGVMSMLSGNYNVNLADTRVVMPLLTRMYEFTTDMVIVINDDLRVVTYNKFAANAYHFTERGVIDTHIRSAIKFKNENVMSAIEDLMNPRAENNEVETEFQSVVTHDANEDENCAEELISLRPVYQEDKPKELVIIITKRDVIQGKLDEARYVHQQIENLKQGVIPVELESVIRQTRVLDLRNVITVFVELCDSDKKSEAEIKQRINKLSSAIDNAVSESKDAIRLRDLGVSVMIGFNMANQHSNMMKVSYDALTFCRRVASYARDSGITIAAGMAYDKRCRAGIISEDRIRFDLFSSASPKAFCLARKAGPYQLIPCNTTYGFLPIAETRNTSQIRLSIVGNQEEWFRIFPL